MKRKKGAATGATVDKYERLKKLSIRLFPVALHQRMHLLKARRMNVGQAENLENLYELVVIEGLRVLEAEVEQRERCETGAA